MFILPTDKWPDLVSRPGFPPFVALPQYNFWIRRSCRNGRTPVFTTPAHPQPFLSLSSFVRIVKLGMRPGYARPRVTRPEIWQDGRDSHTKFGGDGESQTPTCRVQTDRHLVRPRPHNFGGIGCPARKGFQFSKNSVPGHAANLVLPSLGCHSGSAPDLRGPQPLVLLHQKHRRISNCVGTALP